MSSTRKKPSRAAPLRLTLPETAETITVGGRLPLLPLRDLVLFPGMTVPLYVNRRTSLAALEACEEEARILFLVTQRRPETAEPRTRDLYAVGCLVRVLQRFRLPDGSLRVLVEAIARARLRGMSVSGELATAEPCLLPEGAAQGESLRQPARSLRQAFREYADLSRRIAPETLLTLREMSDPAAIAFRVAAYLPAEVSEKQSWLEAPTTGRRLRLLTDAVAERIESLRQELAGSRSRDAAAPRARRGSEVDLLRSLAGDSAGGADLGSELEALAEAIAAARMPAAVREKARRELERLGKMAFGSPEATVARGYLDWLIHLPWRKRSRDRTDLAKVQQILDEDHYGLQKVKERVLEHIAVMKLSHEVRGPILCLSGPPGVGKTSLGRSIARALGRRFVRMSLGGVRDEAEIRGHRRTYIGSMPGRILQAMRRAGTVNPVILLDEVDKLGRDHRGDPAAALLEVLDPEQNCAFNDHYLEVDYDLSRVLFLTTANILHSVPPALQDRMEVIRIPGYLEAEKLEITRRFLLPRQRAASGLAPDDLRLPDPTLTRIIREYTRESGVRNLEREVARICRRVAKLKAGGEDAALQSLAGRRPARGRDSDALGITVPESELSALLGVARFSARVCDRPSRVGVATGLAWTESGGEVLTVEVGVLPGRGSLILTGQLGETMRESAQAALSYIRSRAATLGLAPGFYRRCDLHVHLPEGAIPKDGPSAGVTIALAMASALTGTPTRPGVAMSGEITLRGNVLPVGGLGEKIVAARRAGLTTLLLPRENREHLSELPEDLCAGLQIHPIETMDELLALGLAERPAASPSQHATPDRIGGPADKSDPQPPLRIPDAA